MRTNDRADAINGVFVILSIRRKCRVYRFLERLQAFRDLDDVCAEDLHACNIGSLLFDIHSTHINITFKTEISRRRRKRYAMLTCARFRDDFLFAHVFGKERFTHAMVELMRTRVIEVLAFHVKLDVAKLTRKAFEIGNGGRSALKFTADTAKLADEFAGFADGEIRICDLLHRLFQVFGNVSTTEIAEITVFIRIIFKICIKINTVINHK